MKEIVTCPNCCLNCVKDKKTCEARKSRGRAVQRALYKVKKEAKNNV